MSSFSKPWQNNTGNNNDDAGITTTTTRTEEVLLQVRKDLWNVPLPTFVDPFREFVLDPSLELWTIVLPPLVLYHQGTDTIVATIITYTTAGPLRIVLYMSTTLLTLWNSMTQTTTGSNSKDEMHVEDIRGTARRQLTAPTSATTTTTTRRLKPPSEYASSLRGIFAFTFAASADLLGALLHPHKMKAWMDAITNFRTYLHTSKVGYDLEEAMMKPLYAGRLWDNIKMLHDIQELQDMERIRLIKEASRRVGITRQHYDHADILHSSRTTTTTTTTPVNPMDIELASAMMRYATAAYGTEMVKSAIDGEVDASRLETERQAIAFHTRISQDDIKLLKVREKDFGGGSSSNIETSETTSHLSLRHFIAVDQKHKAIVLALRGTLSISGALVDIQAMDVPFCSGRAHKGIAEMADAVWQESGEFLTRLLHEDMYQHFDLIITGHSLGAGTACLLHMKVHVQELVDTTNHRVLCFGFAPPPTFYWDITNGNCDAIERAIQHSVCYIHDHDCIPHLSVASIRRLATLLDVVDNFNANVWFWNRALMFWGWKSVPDELITIVTNAQNDMERNNDASCMDCEMIIPAKVVIWCKKIHGEYNVIPCCPRAISDRNIFMCENMVAHHMPEQYEDSFDEILRQSAMAPVNFANLSNDL